MTYDIWEIERKSSWRGMSLKALRTLWIYWVFQRFLWNYLKLNCVLISCKLWALHVLPLGCNIWLLGDYPTRYYSLYDISILAPVFMSADKFQLCVSDELRLCVGRLVLALCRQLSCGLMLDFLVWNGIVIAHSV